jgi:pseudaminic acid synthase
MYNILKNNKEVFIIAELSANHNGSLQIALDTIKAAKIAGANAIKIQTYTADTITLNSRLDDFKITQGTIWDGMYLHDLYKEAFTPWEWHKELFDAAKKEGLIYFSSPFDPSSVDLLESLNVPLYKIASFEITDIPLIKLVASKGKPIIISTGIATFEDIELAVSTCRAMGNNQIILLKCTSSYPAPFEEANMLMIRDLAEKFDVISGLSDHTLGITLPIVATCYGARVIEKHFILDKSLGGPDSSFSLDFNEFSEMVKAVRQAELAIGKIDYDLTEKQLQGRNFSRSLYVVKDVENGEEVTLDNVKSIRPGFGLHPKHLDSIIGKKFNAKILAGTRMSLDIIQ